MPYKGAEIAPARQFPKLQRPTLASQHRNAAYLNAKDHAWTPPATPFYWHTLAPDDFGAKAKGEIVGLAFRAWSTHLSQMIGKC